MKSTCRNKPGDGWHAPNPGEAPVYTRDDGLMVHLLGLAMTPDGRRMNGMMYPRRADLDRRIAECGGNVRRGAMVWAAEVVKPGEE